MKRLIYIYCLLFFSTYLFGGENLDSLKQVAKITKNDTLRIQILKTVGEEEGIFRIGYWDSLRLECELKLKNCPDSKKLFFQKSDRLAFRPDWFVGNAQVRPATAVSAEKPRVVENYSLDDSQILTHTPLVLDFVMAERGV